MSSPTSKRKTFDLRLTKMDLVHLRDLFGVSLPNDMTKTVSMALAEGCNRQSAEVLLWKKISEVCVVAGIPLGDEAPDYVVAPTGSPNLSVFQVASDPEGLDDEEE
jgi:hypothetical protein